MKLGAALTLVALGLGAVTFIVTEGCGEKSDDAIADQAGKRPPREEGSPTTATDERVFAVDSISLGDADRNGTRSTDAWKTYGYNLDGLITNATDQATLARVCKRVQGATAQVHQDGEAGTDNAFGKEVLKLLAAFAPSVSKTVTDTIRNGDFTIMLSLVGLSDDPAQTNTGLSGALLVGGRFGADPNVKPTFTTADDWPYVRGSEVPVPGAYINKGVFVNGKGGATVKLGLAITGQMLNLEIHDAIISFRHAPSTRSLEEGTIAGVIDTEELVGSISQIAARLTTDLCRGPTIEGIRSSIRQTSDMLSDGTQDPAKTCNGISVGIGFTAKQVGRPTKEAPPTPAPPDPCDPNAPKDAGATESGANDP